METRKFNVQLITQEGKWPYVGRAYKNHDGSLSLYLNDGVTITSGQRLYIRAARGKSEAPADATSAEAAK